MGVPKEKNSSVASRPPGAPGHAVVLDVLAAGALAWALPGLGHWLCGHRRHAVGVGMGVGFLWLAGLFVGGFSVVDARPAPSGQGGWFYAQAGVGASVVVERLHAGLRGGEAPPALALGHGREVATLYLAAAGLLNAMAIADAMLRAAKPKALAAAREAP